MTKPRERLKDLFLRLEARLGERVKFIRLTYSLIGLAFAGYTTQVVEKLVKLMNDIHVPPQFVAVARDAAQYFAYVVVLFAGILIFQILYIVGEILFSRKIPIKPPPDKEKEIKFVARPMEDHPNVESLTAFAEGEFEGDTMRADVVQGALQSRSAIGLRIQTDMGKNIGFCDFYHLKAGPLQRWLDGKLYEREITLDHFEPIAQAEARKDEAINLFVGALLLNTGNRLHDFHLAPLVVSATRAHLRNRLSRFKAVNIYASIFSKSGLRYAELQGMKPFMLRTERGAAGGGHDIYLSSFRPSDPEDHYMTVSRDNVYVLALKP